MRGDTSEFSLSRRRILGAFGAGIGGSLVPATLFAPSLALGATQYDDGLTRGSPLAADVDPRAVLNFVDTVFANDLDLHSLMLFRHGNVVAEGWSWPYKSHRPHIMHSLTKSVTACAVGLAMDDGHFGLDDKVVSFFADADF